MSDPREDDIQELCKGVLNIEAANWVDGNYRDHYACPICDVRGDCDDLSTFKHIQDCGYLIAKDLSAGAAK